MKGIETFSVWGRWFLVFIIMVITLVIVVSSWANINPGGEVGPAGRPTEYENLITFDPNNDDRRLIYPKYHYRLAKLYEEKGDTQKAIQRYQHFLTIWKNADEDLSEKIDVQKRLARLTGE